MAGGVGFYLDVLPLERVGNFNKIMIRHGDRIPED